MFDVWGGLGDLGESKESILARGCVKTKKGIFTCPDGSTVSPSSSGPAFTESPGGDITTTASRCPPGQYWVGAPVNACMADKGAPGAPTHEGAPPIDTGGTKGTPVTEDTPTDGGLDLGFLSTSVMGIPVWMIAAGIGAVLLLKKR